MAENQTTAAPETAAEPTAGRVTRIQGSVIDVEFPVGHLPDIYNALTVELANTGVHEEGETTKKITLEVEQHLGDSTVRTVALKPTDGLVRGATVYDTGGPISVPVGDVTKGHVFDVSGNILNKKADETVKVTERWPIHRNPPAFEWLPEDQPGKAHDGANGFPGGTIAYRRANGWASITNFGEEPITLPQGEVLLTSGPLTDDGKLPQDTSAWLKLAD